MSDNVIKFTKKPEVAKKKPKGPVTLASVGVENGLAELRISQFHADGKAISNKGSFNIDAQSAVAIAVMLIAAAHKINKGDK